jgi:DNA gyrase/topoisomerase IV subunit B
MFLGKPEISKLQTYIVGYEMGFRMTGSDPIKEDRYFNPGFIEWFYKKYNIKETSFWETPFLKQAKNNEQNALELFFQYLEEYSKSLTEKSAE